MTTTKAAIEQLRDLHLEGADHVDLTVQRRGASYVYRGEFLKELQADYTRMETENIHGKKRLQELENKMAGSANG